MNLTKCANCDVEDFCDYPFSFCRNCYYGEPAKLAREGKWVKPVKSDTVPGPLGDIKPFVKQGLEAERAMWEFINDHKMNSEIHLSPMPPLKIFHSDPDTVVALTAHKTEKTERADLNQSFRDINIHDIIMVVQLDFGSKGFLFYKSKLYVQPDVVIVTSEDWWDWMLQQMVKHDKFFLRTMPGRMEIVNKVLAPGVPYGLPEAYKRIFQDRHNNSW
jgi:hypothetical protein